MSRQNMFLLIACAVAVMIMSNGPLPLLRPVAITAIPPLSQDGTRPADLAMLQPSVDHR